MTALYKNKNRRPRSFRSMPNIYSRLKQNIRRFNKSEDGVAIIEFATIGPMFLMLLLIITDLGIYFFMNRTVEASTDMISRQIKTSVVASDTSLIDLRQKLCELPTMKIFNCDDVMINVQTLTAFEAPQASPRNADGSLNSGAFAADIGPPASINLVTVYVRWSSMQNWIIPPNWVDGDSVIVSTTAFLKEG